MSKTFIKITNEEAWKTIKSIKSKVDQLDAKLDGLDTKFANHLIFHTNKKEWIKFTLPVVLSFLTLILLFMRT